MRHTGGVRRGAGSCIPGGTAGRRRRCPAWTAAVVLSLPLLHGAGAVAEDDTVVESTAQAAGRAAQNNGIDLDQQLAGMLFQPGNDPEAFRQRIEERLAMEISAIDQVAGLTAGQRQACETAAAFDVARLFEAVEDLRDRYGGRTVDLQDPQGQAEWQRFIPEVQAVQTRLQDADGDEKLLARVVPGLLDDEQLAAWRRELDDRTRWQWAGVVDVGMIRLDVALGLTTDQHERIRALLMERPVRIGTARLRQHGGHFIPFVCKYGLSRLDQKQLRAIVNDRQWQALKQSIDQGRGMTQHLKQSKIILE